MESKGDDEDHDKAANPRHHHHHNVPEKSLVPQLDIDSYDIDNLRELSLEDIR